MHTVNGQSDQRKNIKLCITILLLLTPFLVVGGFYATMLYLLAEDVVSKPFRSPNGTFVASVVHHYGDASSIRMEATGFHPYSSEQAEVYTYDVEDGWVSSLTWRDNRTLIVSFCSHQPKISLPKRHWRDITVLFQLDACATAPL